WGGARGSPVLSGQRAGAARGTSTGIQRGFYLFARRFQTSAHVDYLLGGQEKGAMPAWGSGGATKLPPALEAPGLAGEWNTGQSAAGRSAESVYWPAVGA